MTAQGYAEGQSVNRPPLFDGEDYNYWKTIMEFFVQGLDFQLWSIIEEDGDKSIGSSEDEEAFLSRRLQRILAKKKYQSGRRYFKKGKDFKKTEVKDTKKSEPICYECKKPEHIKAECLKLKKTEFRKKDSSKKFKRYKKKAMAAAWSNDNDSDSESSSSEEEEEKANLTFMANIEEKL
ncbi:hypothetical protein Taro_018335 [Colocasia esculenta]|uniref:CCHC-type domain-containing protein n=1 Tax=Colocasia esculenta TaxID=4460 RepID=A0A843UQQ5_COLES|nr:hypothetical protein [Colocasia esculenta]